MPTVTNPDLDALNYIQEILKTFQVTYPDDGSIGQFDDIDIGFQSTPTANPYVSLHTSGSSAPITRLGAGAGMSARRISIQGIIAIEYEHHDASIGFQRLTQIRWDVFKHIIEEARRFPGVDFVDFEEAYVQTFNVDDGDFQDQGFFGQIIIPITVHV